MSASATSHSVPAEIVKSSTTTAVLPATAPMISRTPALSSCLTRSLSAMTSEEPSAVAYKRAFFANPARSEERRGGKEGGTQRSGGRRNKDDSAWAGTATPPKKEDM